MLFVYILKLKQNKYYVGKTKNPNYRLNNHFNYNGSVWNDSNTTKWTSPNAGYWWDGDAWIAVYSDFYQNYQWVEGREGTNQAVPSTKAVNGKGWKQKLQYRLDSEQI